MQDGQLCGGETVELDHEVLVALPVLRLALQPHARPDQPQVLGVRNLPPDIHSLNVDEGPGLGLGPQLGHVGKDLAEESGAAAGGHVDHGHLPVVGIPELTGQPVQGGVGNDDQLLGPEELHHEDKGRRPGVVHVELAGDAEERVRPLNPEQSAVIILWNKKQYMLLYVFFEQIEMFFSYLQNFPRIHVLDVSVAEVGPHVPVDKVVVAPAPDGDELCGVLIVLGGFLSLLPAPVDGRVSGERVAEEVNGVPDATEHDEDPVEDHRVDLLQLFCEPL